MKKILLFVFAFYSFVAIGQITIDETLTAQELVEDIQMLGSVQGQTLVMLMVLVLLKRMVLLFLLLMVLF
jgi:hypothetical protein